MDPLSAFNSLSQFLSGLEDVPDSIEVIPSGADDDEFTQINDNSHYPYLFVDGNIGIPQSILYKAYIAANKQLHHIAYAPYLPDSSALPVEITTAILLIANPAHNSALNRRKQFLQINPPKLSFNRELKFVASLFGNKTASKSSILWHHRRWILQSMYDPSFPPPSGSEIRKVDMGIKNTAIPITALVREFELVSQAGEVYPRNYYAWLHRYFCAECLVSRVAAGIPGAVQALILELEASQRWIELHVSDYTAVHYSSRLIAMLRDLTVPDSFPTSSVLVDLSSPPGTHQNMIRHALSLIVSYPIHGTLWMYLRLALASNTASDNWIVKLVLTLNEDQKDSPVSTPTDDDIQKIISNCRTEEDLSLVKQHAFRLFVWILLLRNRFRDGPDVIPDFLLHPPSAKFVADLYW